MEKVNKHTKKSFSIQEDTCLKNLVEKHGEGNWKLIASFMPGRNERQCRERWNNYLRPNIKDGRFTEYEDNLLLQKVSELGRRWTKIVSFFPGRTEIQIKNRYNCLRRRSERSQSLFNLSSNINNDFGNSFVNAEDGQVFASDINSNNDFNDNIAQNIPPIFDSNLDPEIFSL